MHLPKSTTFDTNDTETRIQRLTEQTHESIDGAITWKPHILQLTAGTAPRKIEQPSRTGKTNVKEIEPIYINK